VIAVKSDVFHQEETKFKVVFWLLYFDQVLLLNIEPNPPKTLLFLEFLSTNNLFLAKDEGFSDLVLRLKKLS